MLLKFMFLKLIKQSPPMQKPIANILYRLRAYRWCSSCGEIHKDHHSGQPDCQKQRKNIYKNETFSVNSKADDENFAAKRFYHPQSILLRGFRGPFGPECPKIHFGKGRIVPTRRYRNLRRFFGRKPEINCYSY